MWEQIKDRKKISKPALPFFDWMNAVVLTQDHQRRADDLFVEAMQVAPEIKQYTQIAQTPPWHSEGPFVSFHIKRILTGIFAIESGASLLDVEEFIAQKHLHAHIQTLQHTILENAATFLALALVHDIGKVDTLAFATPQGSRGEREKFSSRTHDRNHPATEQEKTLYTKLYRSFEARGLNPKDALKAFYDEYEIRAHYFNHATIGASSGYEELRIKIAELFQLSPRQEAIVRFLARHHMDKVLAPQHFELLMARARRAGFDGADIADYFIAQDFLDSAIGCLHYKNGEYSVDVSSVLQFFEAERLAMPKIAEQRQERLRIERSRQIKDALRRAGLESEFVFDLLNIPFGPQRKGVMQQIRDFVAGDLKDLDFGTHTLEIEKRAEKAKDFLTQD